MSGLTLHFVAIFQLGQKACLTSAGNANLRGPEVPDTAGKDAGATTAARLFSAQRW